MPIIDAFWIIVRRLAQGRSPFSPDRGHLHHRLLDVGLSHRQTVLLIYADLHRPRAGFRCCCSGAGQVYAFLGVFVLIGLACSLSRIDLGGPDEQVGLQTGRESRRRALAGAELQTPRPG